MRIGVKVPKKESLDFFDLDHTTTQVVKKLVETEKLTFNQALVKLIELGAKSKEIG